MKFPFLSNNECKVVAAPIEDETQEFSKKSISELTLLEKHYQQRVFRKNYTNTNMLPSDITKSLNDAQNTLVIIQKILRQKLEEQDRAKRLAQQQYVNEELPKHIQNIRYSVNPPSNLNALPFGVTIDTLKWQKTDSPMINFKANVKSNLNGKVITKVEDFTFSLFEISADRFTQMINNPFKPEMFCVGNQTLLVMVT